MITCPDCGAENPTDQNYCGKCGKSLLGEGTGKLNPDTVLADRYIIIRIIGQGGMGAVYLALDTRLNNITVAIKEMSTRAIGGDLQAAIGVFKKEASMLIGLHHPALPRIIDFFSRGEDRWYLVMDYIEGRTLAEVAANRGPIPEAEVLDWGRQLCEILDYLHKQSPPIIFRDLKPANIMLTPQGRIKLIDFGIARHFRQGSTADTSAYGSSGFAPPEQYGENQTDPRSDIYALGATLHYLLTGKDPSKNPFIFEPPGQTVTISHRLETAVMKALELRAENRPANVQELLHLFPGETAEDATRNMALPGSPPGEARTVRLDMNDQEMDSGQTTVHLSGEGPVEVSTVSLPADSAGRSRPAKSMAKSIIIAAACLVILLSAGLYLFSQGGTDTIVTQPKGKTGTGTTAATNPNERGNTSGNIANRGFAAGKGDWIYYCNANDNNKLYKINIDDSGRQKLADDDSLYVNVVGDWVYYCNCSQNSNIYKIRTDGTKRTRLNKDDSDDLNVIGDWIFYTNRSDNGRIYKMRTDGSQKIKLSDVKATFTNVVGDWIYFCNQNDNGTIYKMRKDGSGITKIVDDDANTINIADDWVYYSNVKDTFKMYKIRTDGSQRTKLNDVHSVFLNVVGDVIYFRNGTNGSRMDRIRTDGSAHVIVNTDMLLEINAVGNRIYYRGDGLNPKFYRMFTDVKDIQLVE